MSNLLMIYASTDGHTKKIAERIAQFAKSQNRSVELVDARRLTREPNPKEHDAVMVAASVHMSGYQSAIQWWVRKHAKALNAKTTAFISVCLGVLERKPEVDADEERILKRFLRKCGWHPTVTKIVAGAIPYTRYNFLKKFVMKRIAQRTNGGTDTSRDYEYTDWVALQEFTKDFLMRESLFELSAPLVAETESA